MNMREIRKKLLAKKIRITVHAMKRLVKRGYSTTDIISCIWSGEKTKVQMFNGQITVVVEGLDTDGYPIVIIIGRDNKSKENLAIITVFPPIDTKFKRVI